MFVLNFAAKQLDDMIQMNYFHIMTLLHRFADLYLRERDGVYATPQLNL